MKMQKFLFHEPLNTHNSPHQEECKHHHHTHSHHDHSHDSHAHHSHFDPRSSDKKVLLIAFCLTSSMMIVQFIYSLKTNSLALLSDTLHMFSDAFALALSFLAILATQKFKNENKTFGYFRLEILVAFINGLTILLSALFISYEAIEKLINPSEIDAKTMFIVAIIGFLVNALSGFLMFKGGNLDNINIKSAFLHILSDLLGSLAVIIGGIVVYFTQIYYIDTILGLFIALLLVRWGFLLIKQSVNILLESSPVEIQKIKDTILSHEEVLNIEDLHISQITNKMFVATMHIEIKKENMLHFSELSKKIAKSLYDHFSIGHCTIEPSFKP